MKSPKVESNTKNGTSWALESENGQQTCPIMVKDLENPGHMLIEVYTWHEFSASNDICPVKIIFYTYIASGLLLITKPATDALQ